MTYSTRCATSIFVCLSMAGIAGAPNIAGADDPAAHGDVVVAGEALGTVDFRVACAESSQPAFDRALGFLHHMMYEQARSTFEGIVETDPECAWRIGASPPRCSSRCGPPARAPMI